RDNGPGVAPEARAHLFDPLFSTKPDGMGMGLAISRAIVEAHGGQLWLTTNEDAGVTFHFTLPLA
ncbi:MAG TPA: ATP-binding protein, partial [Polyangiales bacterium]|nr:ATP-binding protein [Polyangiales bacterium]